MKRVMLVLAAFCAVACGAAEPAVRELKILTIGNSFSASVRKALEALVAHEPACKIKIVGANIGGCSLERHWDNFVKSEKDPAFKPYAGGKKSLQELLKSEKWDIVTIQQASRLSWQPDSYQPFADDLVKAIRELSPTAEIVIQQTWSYNSADPRLDLRNPRGWHIDQNGMYEKLTDAYRKLALGHRFRVIPTGYAVQLFRKAMGDKLIACEPMDVSGLRKPEVPKTTDVAGNFSWRKDRKTGETKLLCDNTHLNARGRYLQSLVWYALLFGGDPERTAYVPEGISPEEIALFRKCAKEAVQNFPQVGK